MIAHNPKDALLLQVIDNIVTLRDPVEFSQKYNELQTLRANRSSRAEENRPEPRASKLQAISQHARRWSPFGRLIKLAAILTQDGQTLVGTEKQQVLADYRKKLLKSRMLILTQ